MQLENISFNILNPQPLLIVISGPSGAGKDTVVEGMKKRGLPFHFVVTATSRSPRAGEQHGMDYLFTSKEEFEKMIAQDVFIEYALVYGQYKGVPKTQLTQAIEAGQDVVMRVDVQGAAHIRMLYPEAVLIFIVPDDVDTWYQRLLARKGDTPENLSIRLQTCLKELERVSEYDYVVVNPHNRLDEALDDIQSIIKAEHLRTKHREVKI